MNAIRATAKLNERELELVTPPSASWHRDYDDTAFIYIGGLDTRLSEGDVLTVFSQYGEPVFINLVRDKETGKSKGFCFLKYEDQRSCALAVDNLGGATVLGRMLRVDHTRYKAKEGEEIFDNTHGETAPGQNGGAEETQTESEEEEVRPLLKEELELRKLLADEDDDDPMREFMIQQKREEVEKARARRERKERKERKGDHGERRRRRGSEERYGGSRRQRDDNGRSERKRRDHSQDERRERRRRYSSSDSVQESHHDRRRS